MSARPEWAATRLAAGTPSTTDPGAAADPAATESAKERDAGGKHVLTYVSNGKWSARQECMGRGLHGGKGPTF